MDIFFNEILLTNKIVRYLRVYNVMILYEYVLRKDSTPLSQSTYPSPHILTLFWMRGEVRTFMFYSKQISVIQL